MKQAAPALSTYIMETADPTVTFALAQQIRALLYGQHLGTVFSALALSTAATIKERAMPGVDVLDPAVAPDAMVGAAGLLVREHLRALAGGHDMAVTARQAARLGKPKGAA
ncbi:hypothetical protein EOD42_22265 [Rhodovarius crocodyli]|uniref:Uncharacterized protein n=1 Tax=Rhodovarius crocodyli TaxID=1979269 RepID=A0A437M195_9PROT|nr:hypothetical protein [Rhodovarius crocodyli]RVT91382.1 hypothetical protein EOD42_22265 [Rhodovarius crocodyli]